MSDQQSNSSEDQQRKAFIAKMDDIAGFEMGLGEYEKGFGLVFDYIQANYLPLKQVEAAIGKDEFLAQLENLLMNVYFAGFRDSTRRASGASAEVHAAGLKIIALFKDYQKGKS
jgi:hypothetical protein